MNQNDEQRRRQAMARRKEALLAAIHLLAKLVSLQARLSGARSSKGFVVAAIDQDITEPEDLFCELEELLKRLERELDEEERHAAQAVMYRLAGYIEPVGQALVLGR